MATVTENELRVGGRMLNGATVIAVGAHGERAVVLALYSQPQPYVTWEVHASTGEAYWGHYFDDLGAALVDFNERNRSLLDSVDEIREESGAARCDRCLAVVDPGMEYCNDCELAING